MGEINQLMREYLGLARYNADFWNGTVYCGKRRVKVWQLDNYDREHRRILIRRREQNDVQSVQMLCKGKKDVILALELIDGLEERIPNSIMKRRYGQIPIRTAILYCGEDIYDGVGRVKELLEMLGIEQDYRRVMLNCRIGIYNLLELREENYETSLREIVGVFKRRDDKKRLLAFYLENKERFQQLDELSVDLMGALLGESELKKFPQEKGGIDMCKAFEYAMEEGREKGRREGREAGRREGRKEGSFHALCCLVEKGKLKLKDAADEVGMTEEMFLESMKIAMNA